MRWIWAQDSWTSTYRASDKQGHFNAGFMGTIALLLWPWQSAGFRVVGTTILLLVLVPIAVVLCQLLVKKNVLMKTIVSAAAVGLGISSATWLFKTFGQIPIVLCSLLAAFLWEVKDAYVNYENISKMSYDENMDMSLDEWTRAVVAELKDEWPWKLLIGDGFSWRDMVCSWAGVLVAWGLCMIGGVA